MPETCLYTIGRLYTRQQLRHYVPAMAAIVRHLEPHFRGEDTFVSLNPYLGQGELPLDDAAWRRFNAELQAGRLESFCWFARRPQRAGGAFPFLLRVESEPPNSLYFKRELALQHGVAYPKPPIADHKVELVVSQAEGDRTILPRFHNVVRLLTELFVAAQGTYGYIATDTADVALQGISRLERDLRLYDSLYQHPWIDAYDQRIAGVFRHNLLGRRLAEGLDFGGLTQAGCTVKELPDGAVHLMVGNSDHGIEPIGADAFGRVSRGLKSLLPTEPEDPPALPAATTLAYLVSAEQVGRLGGAAHIREYLPVSSVKTLASGGMVVATELRRRSDDFLVRQHLWPLQPAKCELWEATLPGQSTSTLTVVLGQQDSARRQVRVRVSEAELNGEAGIPLLLQVGGWASKESLSRLQESVMEWLGEEGGTLKSMRATRRSLEAVVALSQLELEAMVGLVEKVSRHEQNPFLLSLGALSDSERRVLESLLKPDAIYVRA